MQLIFFDGSSPDMLLTFGLEWVGARFAMSSLVIVSSLKRIHFGSLDFTGLLDGDWNMTMSGNSLDFWHMLKSLLQCRVVFQFVSLSGRFYIRTVGGVFLHNLILVSSLPLKM